MSNSLSFQKKPTGKKHLSPMAKMTLELDKIYGLRFSNLFLSVNTSARTLSTAVVFTHHPADRQGGRVWLNHILFSRIQPNMLEVV